MKKIRKLLSNNQGFTLIELVIGIVLTAIVILISTRMFISAEFVGTNATYDIKEQGRLVTETLDNSIKYANAVFTVPKNSFVNSKLTKAWSYIGVKENVEIPPAMVDGRTGVVAKALVHIKSVGDTEPTKLNKNQVKIQNGTNGWFIETILGFEFVDPKTGYQVEYNFVLTPSSGSKEGIADSSIKYKLNVAYYDVSSGTKTKVGDDLLNVETEMGGLNSLQIVYRGSTINPATAIAFHDEDYKVEGSQTETVKANMVFIMDISNSMKWCFKGNHEMHPVYDFDKYDEEKKKWVGDGICNTCGKPVDDIVHTRTRCDSNGDGICDFCGGEIRGTALKKNAVALIDSLTKTNSEELRIGLVKFSEDGQDITDIREDGSKALTSNAQRLKKKINDLKFKPNTNIGGGIRNAYFQLNKLYKTYTKDEDKNIPTFVILLTDGETQTITYTSEDSLDHEKEMIKEYGEGYMHNYENFYWKGEFGDTKRSAEDDLNYVYDGKKRLRGTDYAIFTAEHFVAEKNPKLNFPKPTVYIVNLSSTEHGLNAQSEEIMKAFEIKDPEKYIFNTTTGDSLTQAITKIVTDIKVSSSFLDGPMI